VIAEPEVHQANIIPPRTVIVSALDNNVTVVPTVMSLYSSCGVYHSTTIKFLIWFLYFFDGLNIP
jgi:hypothetical protein